MEALAITIGCIVLALFGGVVLRAFAHRPLAAVVTIAVFGAPVWVGWMSHGLPEWLEITLAIVLSGTVLVACLFAWVWITTPGRADNPSS